MSMLPPYLTDDEIAEICDPLVSAGAQVRYLAKLGLVVHRKPSGRPLVARAEFERVMTGRQAEQAAPVTAEPDESALLAMITKGGRHGTQAARR
jgi:hypothetical protein